MELPLDLIIQIVEWSSMLDALEFCNALGISTSVAYQYSFPWNFLLNHPTEKDCSGLDFYYNLFEREKIKDNFRFLFKNKRFNLVFTLSQRLRISVVLQCVNVVELILKDKEIYDLNSDFVYCTLPEIVKIFLADSRYNPCNNDLKMAIKNGNLQALELLLRDGRVDPSDQDNQAVILASETGNLQALQLLLKDDRVDPSDQSNEAIIQACTKGHLQVVELLLRDKRVNPASRRNRAINRASDAGHGEIVQLLLSDSRVLKKGNKSRLTAKKVNL